MMAHHHGAIRATLGPVAAGHVRIAGAESATVNA